MHQSRKHILALLLSTSTFIGTALTSSGQNEALVVSQKKSSAVAKTDTTNQFDKTGLWGYYNLTNQQIGARYNTKPFANDKVYPFATLSHEPSNNNSVGGLFVGIGVESKDKKTNILKHEVAFNTFVAARHSVGSSLGQTDGKLGGSARTPINHSGSLQAFIQLALGITQVNLGLGQYGIPNRTTTYAAGNLGLQFNVGRALTKKPPIN